MEAHLPSFPFNLTFSSAPPTFPSPSPQLPAEIWLKIITYIPKPNSAPERHLHDMLLGVNRVFFDYFMEERYRMLKIQLEAPGKPRDWRRIANSTDSCVKRVRHLYIDALAIGVLENTLLWDDVSSGRNRETPRESKRKSLSSCLTTFLPIKHTSRRPLIYPKVQQFISRLSSIKHLEIYFDDSSASISSFRADDGNGNEEMLRLRCFFGSIWSLLLPKLTQISLHVCPESLPSILPGRTTRLPETQLLQVNSISVAFIISFTTTSNASTESSPPSVDSLDLAWESQCIDSLSRLINSTRDSLRILRLKDWHGYAPFPCLLSHLDLLPHLHSVDLRTQIPASAINSRAYLPETTATASAVASFLTNHDSTLRHLTLDLMEGWDTPPESASVICEGVLAPCLRLSGIHELTINPLARNSRVNASVGLIENLIAGNHTNQNKHHIARLIIKSYTIFDLNLEILLTSQSNRLRDLVYLELDITGAFTRRLFNAFMEKLPALQSFNLRFRSVHYSLNTSDVDTALKLFLGPDPPSPSTSKLSWSPQTILITILIQSQDPTYPNTYSFQSSALIMMALCVLFPTIHSFLPYQHRAYGYDALRTNPWFEYLRLRIERVWPDNGLYSPHVNVSSVAAGR